MEKNTSVDKASQERINSLEDEMLMPRLFDQSLTGLDCQQDAGPSQAGGGTASWWWLRSPGNDSYSAAYVDADGDLDVDGYYVHHGTGGVRPALWLNLKSKIF